MVRTREIHTPTMVSANICDLSKVNTGLSQKYRDGRKNNTKNSKRGCPKTKCQTPLGTKYRRVIIYTSIFSKFYMVSDTYGTVPFCLATKRLTSFTSWNTSSSSLHAALHRESLLRSYACRRRCTKRHIQIWMCPSLFSNVLLSQGETPNYHRRWRA